METSSRTGLGIAARITAARELAGLSNDDLAQGLGVDRKTVERWQDERYGDSIKANRLAAVAAALDVDPTWLLVGDTTEVTA